MKFLIITHVVHKKVDDELFAYEPYVREMNLWAKHVDEIKIIAPLRYSNPTKIDTAYSTDKISIKSVPSFNFINIINGIKACFSIPVILYSIIRGCIWADHIHVRCPGNMGLLGSFVQIFFQRKKKTVKYAGNWDPESKQPWSYRIQKRIVSNTFLSKKCKVLVYGEWKNQTKNIVPFFTASYTEGEILDIPEKKLSDVVKIMYVGGMTANKRPMLTVEAVKQLIDDGENIQLNMFGEGPELDRIADYIAKHNYLKEHINLHGNQSKSTVKKAFMESHFLFFISKSEGWPKVVAEAMFWGCIPITSKVSCIPYMLNNDERGALVEDNIDAIVKAYSKYATNEGLFVDTSVKAMKWSRMFTLNKFESEIANILHS